MLKTLSEQERLAVEQYDKEVRDGSMIHIPVWADEFMQSTFFGFRDDEELVDVGCGFGRTISVIEQLGIKRYFGIDPSEESVKYCRNHYPNYNFEVDELRTLGDHYPERFSGFWLTAVLMHIPRTELNDVIRLFRRSLKPDAVGFCATPVGKEDLLSGYADDGTFNTLFTREEIVDAFSKNGFRIGNMRIFYGMLIWNAITI